MGASGKIGRATLALAGGTLAALAAVKIRDDRYVDEIWQTLESASGDRKTFSEEMVADLPEPAQRYFLHAIRPGTRLASRLHWWYTGNMKPGTKMPVMALQVDQIVAARRGFVWKSRARSGPLFMTAADHYLDGEARMRINLYGLVPVISASGPDIARSSLGRLLVESVALPASILPGPHVRIEAVDESHFRALVDAGGETTPLTVAVDGEGRVQEITMLRWGNLTGDGAFRYIPYGATVEAERTFGGYTIPSQMKVAWWYGTDQYLEQIWLRVDEAVLY